ncbi:MULTISPECIES: hypothetical protein [Providencia]|uniref:Uncharacterized protein n=1 Tax=Providencia rustigianii DSM 4541 TaxID=500637 RepID=D1P1F1_9GAMM|nr:MULTISPECIES: hypothetical protein [Providencia]EFB72737.1 hypothetical protein PROVRUST_06022 [Providencia rustigianii DSM 4541]MTC56693.1 hypothetical protein [Providencia rustigianii]MTC58947.1 hypothetical protein [Providencia rustigianii]SPY78653.1 Uncharacterised protein [Providencia rustigianii]SUC28303.1 Uncharacterised protein [Providencia rustigianii]
MENQQPMTAITVTLNAKLEPARRADLEDAFDEAMEKLGKEKEIQISGGGTLLGDTGEVSECDIELSVTEASDENISLIIQMFSGMLAPKGSRLTIHGEDVRIDFGTDEGLAVYFNGTELPAEVYENNDINDLFDQLDEAVEDIGSIHGVWDGPTETAFYFYGTSFSEMEEILRPLLEANPLSQKCRVVQIA